MTRGGIRQREGREGQEMDGAAARRSEYLLFINDGQGAVVATRHVDRVFQIESVTPVPLAPRILAGLTNLGGTAVPLIDLSALWGDPTPSYLLRGQYGLALVNRNAPYAILARRVLHIETLDPQNRVAVNSPLGLHAFEIRGKRYVETDPHRLFPLIEAQFAQNEDIADPYGHAVTRS